MIQRIQSIWLLLAALFDAITFRFPFYSGDWTKDTINSTIDLNARTTIAITLLTVVVGILAFVNIFLFENRKLQLRLCILGILATIGLLVVYFFEINNFLNGNIALWCIFHFAILACYILAARGIRKDQKLIRSMDRLR